MKNGFEGFLRFFVNNARMNYVLFFLVFAAGIWSYNKMPKEIFPTFDMDMVSISGSYTGASVDILDKMAVGKIEDNVKSLEGVIETTTIISPGKFTIVLELQKGKNRYNMADKIKDAVSLTKGDLPSDMDEPRVTVMDRSRDLINISLTSQNLNVDQMKIFAEDFKSKILTVSGISEVTVFGDSDKYYEILLDDKKLEAYGINKNELFDTIGTLSYIFPIGKIEDTQKHYYISTYNGAKTAQELANTLIKLSTGSIYLSDVATIKKRYEDSSTLYSFNGKNSISLAVKQLDSANAMKISEDIKKIISKIQPKQKDIDISISDDNSERIKERLDIVGSNILIGIIFIVLLVWLLINGRMSFIIFIGIPTSFVIAAVYMHLFGFSINLISLVGVLIAIGIVVDDAIVVSENIQQHIEEGMEPKEAAIQGANEMVKPVTIASLTTLFSFLPALMISGTMGEVMKLIPIALSALVVASLIESFIFLPIHAAHTLKNGAKVTNWGYPNKIYNEIIHFFMRWKKTFLTIFIILVPILTVTMVKSSKFQMFPTFDADDIKISIKANQNTTLDESFEIVKQIEKDLIAKKDIYHIRSIDSRAGYRRDSGSNTERFPYVMYMTVELEKLQANNFLDRYITPYLSFYYDSSERTRTKTSQELSRDLKEFLKQNNYKQRYNLTDLSVLERKVGPIKADVKVGLVSNDDKKIVESIEKLTAKLKSIEGTRSVANSAKFGIDEIKLKVNSYGQRLGVTEASIGSYLSNLYLTKKKSVSFDVKEMLDIKIESLNKDDFEAFKNTMIPLSDGSSVRLYEVCDFEIKKSFEQLTKDNGEKNFYIYANVDTKIITASEVMEQIQPMLNEIKKNDIKVVLKGEAKKNKELARDMIAAAALAVTLIMLSMLYLFNSFRETAILMSVIPFSFLGVLLGHKLLGLNLSMPSIIGALGLAGVVINDGIIMMTYLKKAKTLEEIFIKATKRFRPIMLTTITTLIGMSSLIFFATGQAVIFQPIAIALGFGLAWGTVLNLIYLPVIYTISHKIK
ncbi:MAG: efflux RND transporter permease subunit [Campylobacterota bacterium]|nr:efflux RND transporter permease subunit [Campylobacterota bacterium]